MEASALQSIAGRGRRIHPRAGSEYTGPTLSLLPEISFTEQQRTRHQVLGHEFLPFQPLSRIGKAMRSPDRLD